MIYAIDSQTTQSMQLTLRGVVAWSKKEYTEWNEETELRYYKIQ